MSKNVSNAEIHAYAKQCQAEVATWTERRRLSAYGQRKRKGRKGGDA